MCWPLPELPGPAASTQSCPPPRAAAQSKHSIPVAASAVDPSSENKAAAAALRANIGQKPKVPTTVPSEHSRADALPAAASGSATAAAADSQAAKPAVVNLVANNPNLRRNPGRQSLPHGGKLTYPPTSRTLNPNAPNTVSHTPQTLNPNAPNTRNPNTPTPNTRKQPPVPSLSAHQAKMQPFQRPQPHFATPPKRPVQPRQPPGRPHQPPVLNLAANDMANPKQSQSGQQADFEYDNGYHAGRDNSFTGNFSYSQVGHGHDYMPYSDFDPSGFHDEPLRSQYNDFPEAVPNYSCGVPAPVVGNAAKASYGADPEAVVGQKRKFSGPPQAGPRPTQRPFIRGPEPPVGPAQAPEYPINGHTSELVVQGDYDAHNPQVSCHDLIAYDLIVPMAEMLFCACQITQSALFLAHKRALHVTAQLSSACCKLHVALCEGRSDGRYMNNICSLTAPHIVSTSMQSLHIWM